MICPGLCPNLGRIWPDSPNAIKNMITDRLQAHLSNKRNIFRRFDMVSFAKFKHPRTLADPSNALHETDCVEPWSPVSAIIMMDQTVAHSGTGRGVNIFARHQESERYLRNACQRLYEPNHQFWQLYPQSKTPWP